MMGSTSWHDNILQALLIGLVVQIVVSILCVLCAFLWTSWKKRMARPSTGESMAESDVEMGPVNVGEGATIPGGSGVRSPLISLSDHSQGLAANSGIGVDCTLEITKGTTDTRASTPEIPTMDHLACSPRPSARTSLKL